MLAKPVEIPAKSPAFCDQRLKGKIDHEEITTYCIQILRNLEISSRCDDISMEFTEDDAQSLLKRARGSVDIMIGVNSVLLLVVKRKVGWGEIFALEDISVTTRRGSDLEMLTFFM